ncbi:MAG: phosphoenolpyruvate--protein phosphotransferase [Mariprofundaceae bacterium]|nr:phosphoenolpyruvate--protein phosphotransferase [Mariprofundaceae bacterium]
MRAHQRTEGSAIACSSGVVIGRVQKFSSGRPAISEIHLPTEALEKEQSRLSSAVQAVLQELNAEHAHLLGLGHHDPVLILEAHRMLLLDPELVDKALELIVREKINAEWALRRQLDVIEAVFDCIEDEYLRSKKNDVAQVVHRIMSHLMGHAPRLESIQSDPPIIFVADDLSPSDIVSLWRLGATGVICQQGGVNAHSIIIARGIGLPALVGSNEILCQLHDGDLLILDAERGCWIAHPTVKEQGQYQAFIEAMDVVRGDLKQFSKRSSQSRNGYHMDVMANLEFREEAELAVALGVDGVGLFRTEFIFMQDVEIPSEIRQYQQYREIVKAMSGSVVTFRLLDIGGDKPALFQQLSGCHYNGENPAMGLRGVRMLLQWPAVLKAQVRAILRASEYGRVNILVPMVTNCSEMIAVREIVNACCKELGVSNTISVGCMIEVPGAVMIADDLAEVSDFFSIGTNDLIQYTLAADRGDEDMSYVYSPEHPAILQLIKMTVKAAHKTSIPVTICGELAANPEWTQVFLNLGLTGLSMSLNSVLMIRRHLSKLEYKEVT